MRCDVLIWKKQGRSRCVFIEALPGSQLRHLFCLLIRVSYAGSKSGKKATVRGGGKAKACAAREPEDKGRDDDHEVGHVTKT